MVKETLLRAVLKDMLGRALGGLLIVGSGRWRRRKNKAKQDVGFSVTKTATVLLIF